MLLFSAPFDVALGVLTIMCVLIVFTWPENFGDAKADFGQSFREAYKSIVGDNKVLCLGLIQSLFEGSMYTFVLEWTPALTPSSSDPTPSGTVDKIPHGMIFACFMVAVMIGSSLFRIFSKWSRPESFMRSFATAKYLTKTLVYEGLFKFRYVLLVSALCLAVPVIFPNRRAVVFVGFICFEVCVGIFWPSTGFMRGLYVPEAGKQ